MNNFQKTIRQWTLFLGVLQVTIGCLIAFIPPTGVSWFRGILMAHLEYTANGVLMIALGFLVPELKLGSKALKVWFVTTQLGTWTNGTAGVVAAFSGISSTLMPTLNEKFPPPGGVGHPGVTGLLQICGVTMMVSLFLTLYGMRGFIRKHHESSS